MSPTSQPPLGLTVALLPCEKMKPRAVRLPACWGGAEREYGQSLFQARCEAACTDDSSVSVLVGGAAVKGAWNKPFLNGFCLHLIWSVDFQDMSVAILTE